MKIQFEKIHLGLLALFILFISTDVSAQGAPYGVLGLRRIYQSTLINPVLIPDSTAVENSLSFIPFVPASPFDMSIGVEMGSLRLGTVTSAVQDGTLNVNAIINGMSNSRHSDFFINNSISLMHAYLKVSKKGDRIEISQRLKNSINTNLFNRRTFEALLGSNDDQTTSVIDMTDTRMQAMSWNELAFGYTTKFGKKWTVGTKLKYLTGVAYSDFKSKHLVATIGPDGNSFNIDSQLRTASLNPIADEVNGQDMTPYKSANQVNLIVTGLTKNMGFGMDAGVGYQISKTVKTFGGFNDLGFINWKNNPLLYTNKVIIDDFYPVKYNEDTEKYESDFSAFTNSAVAEKKNYKVYLNTHLNAGATWQPKSWFHTTALLDAYVIDGGIAYPGGTIAGTLNGGRIFEFTMNAGYNQDRPFRVGTGMSLKLGPLQGHVFSNNIVGVFDASRFQSFDVQFGLSWAWRHKEKNYKVAKNDPLSDKDNDGVADKDDACIELAGPVENYGCPWKDTDGDTVLDKDDACIAEAGPAENKGCPWKDTDGDTVLDKDDACIADAGPKENNGCPWKDTDGDTVLDKDDACMAVAGPVENKGCPWKDTDGDTVLDKDDACMELAGPLENKGCPWKDTDGDLVLDKDDSCIEVPGTVANKGCPEQVTKALVKALEVKAKSIFFNSGKATFKIDDNNTFGSLDMIKDILVNYPNAKFSIEGYTDNVGSPKSNLKLSQQRANAVRKELISRGVSPANLIAKGYGASKPVASNKTEKGREQNRRTLIKHIGSI